MLSSVMRALRSLRTEISVLMTRSVSRTSASDDRAMTTSRFPAGTLSRRAARTLSASSGESSIAGTKSAGLDMEYSIRDNRYM